MLHDEHHPKSRCSDPTSLGFLELVKTDPKLTFKQNDFKKLKHIWIITLKTCYYSVLNTARKD